MQEQTPMKWYKLSYSRISFSSPKFKKREFIISKSFHGYSTISASSHQVIKEETSKNKYYNLPLEPILMNPQMSDNGFGSLLDLEEKLDQRVAAIMLEGSSGSAGCILYPPGYLKKVEKLCRDRNILIICDEVMSGFGRTGEFIPFKQGITPDLITCAKPITSGYVLEQ